MRVADTVLREFAVGVHIVLATEYVNAILCKHITPWLHQSGTLPEMP